MKLIGCNENWRNSPAFFYKTGKTRGAIRLNQNRNGRILIGRENLINDNTSNLTAFNTHKSTIKIPNLNQIIESN